MQGALEHRREPLTPNLNGVRHLKALAPGAVLCREDDPPGQAYLVVSGSLRVYRRDRKNPRQREELAELGPGSIVGELSSVLNQPRTATVQAATSAQVLAIPSDQLRDMARTHSSLLRVLILALQERAGMSPTEITALATALRVDLSDVREVLEQS
jgi:CRP/FNR family cyclic AMP-dependent transcriptional regulator